MPGWRGKPWRVRGGGKRGSLNMATPSKVACCTAPLAVVDRWIWLWRTLLRLTKDPRAVEAAVAAAAAS